MDSSISQNFSTIVGFSTILTVHLVEKVILVIQVLSTILQVSTILQSTIAGFYCNNILGGTVFKEFAEG